MKTTYEWVAEPLDEYGDIIDPLFGDTLEDVKEYAKGFKCESVAYALVQNIGDDINGLADRGYSYIQDDGTLQEYFDNDRKVPEKFGKIKYFGE